MSKVTNDINVNLEYIAGYMTMRAALKQFEHRIKNPCGWLSPTSTEVTNIEINLKSKYSFDMLVITSQGMEIVSINCYCKQFD